MVRRHLRSGLYALLLASSVIWAPAAEAAPPPGFKPLFDGKTTRGWHWSRINHHGSTPIAAVEGGELVLKQAPYGQGGLLLTDKKYRNFEFYAEVLAPWASNSGLFFRSSEGGSAYQVELAQLAGTGNLLGELMSVTTRAQPLVDVNTVWKPEQFNAIRFLMDGGDVPRMALWINEVKIWEVQQVRNDNLAGEGDGRIGLQLHWTSVYDPPNAAAFDVISWKPGAVIRFRNLAIKELP